MKSILNILNVYDNCPQQQILILVQSKHKRKSKKIVKGDNFIISIQLLILLTMKAELSHFDSAKKDFELLKKSKEIPPQMQVKLEYLLAKVQKRSIGTFPIESLPEYEKNSLDQLNLETGVQLFCNIVNCLSGKDVVLYFRDQKAYIRKDDLLALWKQCWITCDSEKVLVRKKIGQKPSEIFQVVDLRISKNFKLYKKKYVFGACYNKKKNYLIGFQFQATCARIHELMRGLIRQRVNRITKRNSDVTEVSLSRVIEPFSSQQMPQSPQQKTYEEEQIVEMEEKDQEVDENSDRGVVIEFIKEQELNGDSMYKILKTQENLRQLINKNYVNKFKTEIILAKPKSPENVFDHYLKMNEWNPEIEECSIKIKLSDNSYLLQVRVKKYSYLSWPRETVLLATALRYRNNCFLVLRSTGEECSYSDTVSLDWNQVVQVCQSQDKVLMSISTEMDFKGYSSIDDSSRMGLKVLDSLKFFTKFYEAKEISSKSAKLFNLVVDKKVVRRMAKKPVSLDAQLAQSITLTKSEMKQNSDEKIRKMSGNSQLQVELPDDDSRQQQSEKQQPQKQLKFEKNEAEFDPQNFTMYMLKNDTSEVSPKLIQLIRQKVQEKYYLKQKFDQEAHYDPKRGQFSVEGPNHYIYQNGNWKVNEEEDLVFINTKLMEIQKDVIKMIIKQLSSNIMSGKSIMNMSLPVQVFDFRSILERVAIGLGYAPKFLIPASETDDLVQQAKLVALFILGLGPLHLCLTKPFNPILGETFQCRIGGIPLYLQQISHHPPISAVLMKTQNFVLHGAFHSHAEMGLNRVTGRNLSPLFIDFPKTNTSYEVKLPDMEVSGLIHGQKKYRSLGKCFILEKTNNRFIQWTVGKDKKKVYQAEGKTKPNQIYGGIFTVSPGFAKKFRQCENKQKFDGLKPDDVIETHSKITGHWCFSIFFDGVKVKSVENPLPNKVEYCQNLLPSDSNFRTDLLYKRIEDMKTANEEKQILENIQRRDRKLREGKLKAK